MVYCTVEGNVVSECPLKYSPTSLFVCLCVCVCMCTISLNICQRAFHRAWKSQAMAMTMLRSQPWKRRPLALFRDCSHSWCGSTSVHTPMIIHSGVIVLHISPLARQSVTVAAGHTWVIQGSAVLISMLRWRCWWGEGYLVLVSLWL